MNAPGRPMMSTFLPAHALRTSRKTGGLNSRPSCVRGAVCYAVSRLSGLVSAGRRADSRFAVTSSTLRDGRRRLVPQPSRADVARETSPAFSCGTRCYMHGPAHRGSSPRPSPWLRPSANASRPVAPFLRRTRPVGGPTTTTNGNVSHLREVLSAWSLGVEASLAVLGIPQRTTSARANALG